MDNQPENRYTDEKSCQPHAQRIAISGVTANLLRRNIFASGVVSDFQKISEFVPNRQQSKILWHSCIKYIVVFLVLALLWRPQKWHSHFIGATVGLYTGCRMTCGRGSIA